MTSIDGSEVHVRASVPIVAQLERGVASLFSHFISFAYFETKQESLFAKQDLLIFCFRNKADHQRM